MPPFCIFLLGAHLLSPCFCSAFTSASYIILSNIHTYTQANTEIDTMITSVGKRANEVMAKIHTNHDITTLQLRIETQLEILEKDKAKVGKKLSALHGHCDFLTEDSKRLAAVMQKNNDGWMEFRGVMEGELQGIKSLLSHTGKRLISVSYLRFGLIDFVKLAKKMLSKRLCNGFVTRLQYCCSAFAVFLQCFCSAFAVLLQCCCSAVVVLLQC
jgi:hypothetical protein